MPADLTGGVGHLSSLGVARPHVPSAARLQRPTIVGTVKEQTQDRTIRPPRPSFQRDVIELWKTDVRAWERNGWRFGGSGRLALAGLLVRYNGLRATFMHRLARWADARRFPLVPTLLCQLNVAWHAIEMPPSVPVGPGFYLPHTVGSVITAERIGANVTIQGGVTVGMSGRHAFPRLEDGVFLGAGCRVLGAVTVGHGSTVGANAVVVRDVDPCTTVVGVPARPVPRAAGLSAALAPARDGANG